MIGQCPLCGVSNLLEKNTSPSGPFGSIGVGLVGWCEGVMYLTFTGRPTDTLLTVGQGLLSL